MKAIINKKLYNTETATVIKTWSNGLKIDHPEYMEETLYQKKNGEFFLHKLGGPFAKYGPLSWGYGCGDYSYLLPVSNQEVKDWLSKHSFSNTYIELFGKIEE